MVQDHDLSLFEAEVDGFSGPFDLLCYLVENKQLEAAAISVGQVVKIYGAFLANTGRVSVAVVSKFLSLAASLVLNKVRSLLPQSSLEESGGPDVSEGDERWDVEEVEEKLSRYRPYRKGALFLAEKKIRQDNFFIRRPPEEEGQSWDLGDLYGLCSLWWAILGERRRTSGLHDGPWEAEEEWDEAPAIPEEGQIDLKIAEIMALLKERPVTALSALLSEKKTVGAFVVTLLALLEMSRLGRVRLVQEELFRDVLIYSF